MDRLLPFAAASGTWNMAADEVLLEAASRGIASLRFYAWSEPTVSLGYFQPARVHGDDPLLAALPFVRRPSGGMTLVHHHELTYALALPAGIPWQTAGDLPWLCRMHRIIAAALTGWGVHVDAANCAIAPSVADPLCFHHHTPGDLLIRTHKVVGSAQRRQRGALLQHGAVLLDTGTHAPQLPGIRALTGTSISMMELTNALTQQWRTDTGWKAEPAAWTTEESRRVDELQQTRYSQNDWNRKR